VLRQVVPWLCVGLFAPMSRAAAQACEFCFCSDEFGGPVLEENVPSNARILVRGSPSSRFVLRGMNGPSIALVTEPSSVRGFVWVSPSDPLPVRAKYMLEPEGDADADAGAAAAPDVRFRVSVVGYKDQTPPTATGFTIKPEMYTANCMPSPAAATLRIDWLSDLDNTEGYSRFYVLVEVTVDGVSETAVFRSFGGGLLTHEFGADNGCFFTHAIERARPGVPASAVVSVLDQAGNKVSSGPLAFEFAPVAPTPCPTFNDAAAGKVPAADSGGTGGAGAQGAAGVAGAQDATSKALSAAGAPAETQPVAATRAGCAVAAPGGTTDRRIQWLTMLALIAGLAGRWQGTRSRSRSRLR
jgi:hypothetical protein